MYHLQVLTPEEVFFDDTVYSLIAPGAAGYLGVLKDHAPLIASLQEGILVISDKNYKKQYYQVSGGFLEVNQNNVFLLVNSIQPTAEVDMGTGI